MNVNMRQKELQTFHVQFKFFIVEIIPIQTNMARRFIANSIGIS
jgi:hypothetical protein